MINNPFRVMTASLLNFSPLAMLALSLTLVAGCSSEDVSMNEDDLTQFANRYASAWSSGDPAELASFYKADGSLTVNGGEPAVGRNNVEATARDFMTAFPDMVVELVRVQREGEQVVFHWRWTGTNTGPGGTGSAVDLTGYEKWRLDDGLIAESLGYYDQAEYQRQLDANR